MAQGSLLTNIFSKVVTGVLDEMVDAVESVSRDVAAQGHTDRHTQGRRSAPSGAFGGTVNTNGYRTNTANVTGSGTTTVNTSSSGASQRLPLTDEKGRCMGCGNRCRPVRPNCKKRQKALAKWRPS